MRASIKSDPLYTAVENMLKGPEISLLDHGQEPYVDKDGHTRERARLRWWHDGIATLRHLAEMGGRFHTRPGDPYPELPDIKVSTDHQRNLYTGQVPVIYGHYWRQGTPDPGHDWTDYTACVDFSAVKDGALTEYRWSGELRIVPKHYVSVKAQVG